MVGNRSYWLDPRPETSTCDPNLPMSNAGMQIEVVLALEMILV